MMRRVTDALNLLLTGRDMVSDIRYGYLFINFCFIAKKLYSRHFSREKTNLESEHTATLQRTNQMKEQWFLLRQKIDALKVSLVRSW